VQGPTACCPVASATQPGTSSRKITSQSTSRPRIPAWRRSPAEAFAERDQTRVLAASHRGRPAQIDSGPGA
jgi:hypothetical protein